MARLGTPIRERARKRSRTAVIQATAIVAVGAILVGGAIVAQGFDVKQTPLNDGSVWALQNGATGQRYARINTELGEIDTVKNVTLPTEIVQSSGSALLFSRNNQKVVDVNAAKPLDFGDDLAEYSSTPEGTTIVAASRDYVGYLTGTGQVWVSPIAAGAGAAPVQVDPYADDETAEGETPRVYKASAIAVSPDGILYSYSTADATMLRYDIEGSRIEGQDAVADGPRAGAPKLTVVGSTWVLVDAESSALWIEGRAGSSTSSVESDFVVQKPSDGGSSVYVADGTGLYAYALSNGDEERVFGGTGSLGIPADPTVMSGNVYGAWIPQTGTSGTLWNNVTGETALDYAGGELAAAPLPAFQNNGSRLIVNDKQSGWVWTVPDGRLVPSSQDWTLAADDEQEQQDEEEQATEVLDPKPPVAEDDDFGVRAGQQVLLPVLLNDHDPNEDVLTVVATSVSGLKESFGTLTTVENDQAIAVDVAAGVTGTATFTYQVSDGTRADGRLSEKATVTLTVVGTDTNHAPEWCGGSDECLAKWPTPDVKPGGTVSTPVLSGWVDPDGDPYFIESVGNPSDVGSVTPTTTGSVVFQHPNPASQDVLVVPLEVHVADVRGASAMKVLNVRVTPTPRLTVEPFALATTAGQKITVDPREHISGVAGRYRITSATVPEGSSGTNATSNGGSTFDFSASAAGVYAVAFVIADDANEVESFVRITVLARDDAKLTTAPVTVFVRPKADTTVDVFSAVSNPAGRVLLLSDARPKAVSGASLDVDIVGQNVLRVRGTTASQQPGRLGTIGYTVSDGSSSENGSVMGEATVFLLPAAVPQAPIAVDDAVTVRAGAQIDIPVLENDIAPGGNIIVLNPEAVKNESKKGLAFASTTAVRYLAPREPGNYEVRYGIYSAGSPDFADNGTVRIEVLADTDNRAPIPRDLSGRVLSGETIEVPFDGYGIDPDGDEVALETVVSQPKSGTASISTDGDSLRYTSVIGFQGAVEFEYAVRDTNGDSGTAVVRIGVLDQQTDPSPITFSDYVEVQAGDDNTVRVYPLANDLDPAGNELTLLEVLPDAQKSTPEFADLKAHIGEIVDGEVTLAAGADPGLYSFTYRVENSEGDIGIGLIVMKVVRAVVPDYPVVTDTVLSIEERATLPKGVDVVTGKVSWATGDVNDLTLSFYGKPAGMTLSGWRIRGEVPLEGALIPFVLTGKNFAGEKVTTYGFFRIPAKDSIILALRAGDVAQNVKENESVSFDMAELVPVPAGDVLEVASKGLRSSGQRAAAKCSLDGTVVTYKAGAGSPWSDTCAVPVRLKGQSSFTQLVVPIAIEPPEPQPELRPASLTLSPGAKAETFDLTSMVRWQGAEDWDNLEFSVSYTGDQFFFDKTASTIEVRSKDDSDTGREEAVTVRITSHDNVVPSSVTLKVGPAPSVIPKGGTTAKECRQSQSNPCLITVIGIPGEYNYYDTKLTVVDVAASSTCVGVTFDVASETQVRANWTDDTPGGQCQASFTVADVRGTQSAADRNGSVTVDLLGYPKTPASVVQSGYGDQKVTLDVDPGASASAYPPVDKFYIYRNGQKVGECNSNGNCQEMTGLVNGTKQTYEVKAHNSVGESRGQGVTTVAWAYVSPGIGPVTATPIYSTAATTEKGAVRVVIADAAPSARGYYINDSTSLVTRSPSGTTTTTVMMSVGQRTVKVVPKSEFEIPSGQGPDGNTGFADVTVAGLPTLTLGSGPTTAANNSITLAEASATANNSTAGLSWLYIAYQGGNPSCSVNPSDGSNLTTSASNYSTTPAITGLTKHRIYKLKVCVSNGFGVAQANAGEQFTWEKPAAPAGTIQYDVERVGSGGEYRYTFLPHSSPDPDFSVDYTSTTNLWGPGQQITVRYCANISGYEACSDSSPVTAVDATRSYKLRVQSVNGGQCVAATPFSVSLAGQGLGSADYDIVRIRFNPDGILGGPTEWIDGNIPPEDEGRIEAVTIRWKGDIAGLGDLDRDLASDVNCTT
jgi:large repetitive protein